MTRTTEEKHHALLRQTERGRIAAALMDDANVKVFLADLRNEFIEAMIGVEPGDDALRRTSAFQIDALDKLTRHLASLAGIGEKASDQINKLKAQQDRFDGK